MTEAAYQDGSVPQLHLVVTRSLIQSLLPTLQATLITFHLVRSLHPAAQALAYTQLEAQLQVVEETLSHLSRSLATLVRLHPFMEAEMTRDTSLRRDDIPPQPAPPLLLPIPDLLDARRAAPLLAAILAQCCSEPGQTVVLVAGDLAPIPADVASMSVLVAQTLQRCGAQVIYPDWLSPLNLDDHMEPPHPA